MASVIIFDENDPIVPNRVIEFLQSGNTPDYENLPNALINPDISAVSGVLQKYWKVESGKIVPMNSIEQRRIDNIPKEEEVQTVRIVEENLNPKERTQGHYKIQGYSIDIPPKIGTSTHVFTIPYPIAVFSMVLQQNEKTLRDSLSIEVMPSTMIGVLTKDARAGETELSVNSIDNCLIGAKISLNSFDCGYLLEIDSVNSRIKVQNPLVEDFKSSTPVLMTVEIISEIILGSSGVIELGDKKIGGVFIPANTPIHVRYGNRTEVEKTFSWIVEFLY
jgi:hypothetical protein